MNDTRNVLSLILCFAALSLAVVGCGTGSQTSVSSAVPSAAGMLQGSLHGGQQPVSGANVQLYAVSTGGYYHPSASLLSKAVVSDTTGSFNISGDYNCSGADQVYLVATGGNPGLGANGSNPALALMAALGSCSSLLANSATTYISVNELTTVAAAWPLSHFMSSPSTAGTSSTNTSGLANAFAAAAKVVNTGTGATPGVLLPAGAVLPIAEIDTLADILAACVNSDGNTRTGSPCAVLFAAATPPGGSVPADTITAALNIARCPANNVAALYALATAFSPFQPTLTSAPDNWMIGIHYVGGGLNQPGSLTVDAGNNVWATNNGASSVSEFNNAGAPLSPSSGYTDPSLSGPSALAIDASGNAWVANATGNSLTMIAPLGSSFTSLTGGGLSGPSAIAIDGYGNLFVASKPSSTVTEFSSSGAVLSTSPYTGGGLSLPASIAIDSQ